MTADDCYSYFIALVIIWKHSAAWWELYPALAVTWGALAILQLTS